MWKCNEQLWRTNKGKIVHDGDPRAAFLMATPGMVLENKPVIEPLAGERAEPSEAQKSQELAETLVEEQKALELEEDKAVKPSEDKAVNPSRSNRSGAHRSRGQ